MLQKVVKWLLSLYGVITFAFVVGLVLRIFQLDKQILTGDEWHSLHMVIATNYAGIASSFGSSDHTIPITLYFELLVNTLGLQQWGIYLPFVISGLMALILLPILCEKYIGTVPAKLLVWLLALSPFLIIYSRFARPYMPATLLAFLAVYHFFRWQETKENIHALAYLASVVVTSYFMLAYLPFIFGPFLFFLPVNLSARTIDFPRLRQLLKLFFACMGCMMILVGPPLWHDYGAIDIKLQGGYISPATMYAALNVLLGDPVYPATLLPLLLAAIGLWAARKQKNRFLIYLTALALLQMIGVWIVSPLGSENPIITARYILPVLISLLLLSCYGLVMVCKQLLPSGRWLYPAVFTLALLPIAVGTLPHLYYWPNNAFALNGFARFIYGSKLHDTLLMRTSEFYRALALERPGSLRLVETPFHYNLDHFFLYQQRHRQYFSAGYINGLCGEPKTGVVPVDQAIYLRNFFYLTDLAQLRRDKIDFVVFHKNNTTEINYPSVDITDINVDGCIARYKEWVGAPGFEDQDIVVFGLSANAIKFFENVVWK